MVWCKNENLLFLLNRLFESGLLRRAVYGSFHFETSAVMKEKCLNKKRNKSFPSKLKLKHVTTLTRTDWLAVEPSTHLGERVFEHATLSALGNRASAAFIRRHNPQHGMGADASNPARDASPFISTFVHRPLGRVPNRKRGRMDTRGCV